MSVFQQAHVDSRKGEKIYRLVKYVFSCSCADYPSLGKSAEANRTGVGLVGGIIWLGLDPNCVFRMLNIHRLLLNMYK